MRNIIRACAVVLATVVGCLGFGESAFGVTWASKASPLYGYEGGHKFGKAYGNFYNEGGVYARSSSYQADLQPGGYDVRVETDYYFYEDGIGCENPCWLYDTSLQTNTTDDPDWVFDYRRRSLHGGATAARGGINICEIQPWQNDPCSPRAWASFAY